MMKQYSPPIEQLQCCLVKHQCCNFHLYGAASEQVESRQYTVVGPLTYAGYGLDVVEVQGTIFPVKAVSDYGVVYLGMSSVDWIVKKGLAHPRADVDGVRFDGTKYTCMLRDLDLSVSPVVYVNGDPSCFPGEQVNAIVSLGGSIDPGGFSKRVKNV